MSILDDLVPSNPIINNTGSVFYGLGIDPFNNAIYVADALDYVQSGVVYRYDSLGNLNDQYSVGIIPQSFWFK